MRSTARLPTTQCAILSLAAIAAAQPCLPDQDDDRRPIFAATYQRPNTEFHDGSPLVGTPAGMTVTDLDADGWPDVVVANNEGGAGNDETASVGILYGEGDGMFAPTAVLETKFGWETTDVAIGDFNADGMPDIAAANAAADTVSVFLNLGDREFTKQVSHPVGDSPRSIVAADFDGDGLDDLATADTLSETASVLLAAGDGAFAPAASYYVPDITQRGLGALGQPYPGPFLAAGDLDGDGDTDLAVPADDRIHILLNDGAGAFEPAPDHPTGLAKNTYAVRIADLDDDGVADIAAAILNDDEAGFTVVLNQGAAAWADPTPYDATFTTAFTYRTSISLGDVDNDGDLDAAIGEEINEAVLLYRNNGDGTFAPFEQLDAPKGPWLVSLSDANADDWTDLVLVSNFPFASLHTILNDGAGDLLVPTRISNPDFDGSGHTPDIVRTGDLDGDGDEDALGIEGRLLFLIENTGDGPPTVVDTIELPIPTSNESASIADLDGDGLGDILLVDRVNIQNAWTPGRIRVMRNLGGFEFETAQSLDLDTISPRDAALADLDADGDLDAVAVGAVTTDEHIKDADRHAMVLMNRGDATFELHQDLVYATMPWKGNGHHVVCADLDGDDDIDAAATAGHEDGTNLIAVLLNDGTGKLAPGPQITADNTPLGLAVADLDSDDDTDLAFLQRHNNAPVPYLHVYANAGAGDFALHDEHADPNISADGHLSIADMDDDGALDIVVAEQRKGVVVHTGRGDATFDPATRYSILDTNYDTAVADLDNDGRTDAIATNATSSRLESFTFLKNRACPPCPADTNDDGTLDILDFVTFQQLFLAGDPAADCNDDAKLTNPADFICYQQRFQAGCP